jgi:hypothetical protein
VEPRNGAVHRDPCDQLEVADRIEQDGVEHEWSVGRVLRPLSSVPRAEPDAGTLYCVLTASNRRVTI